VLCTKTTPFTVALNGGTTTGGNVGQRLLANGANTLQYNLFIANTYATVWGDGTGTSVTQSGAGLGLGTAVPLTVYGQLPDNATNQGAVPGNYTDTITVSVSY
jgi:spore coat protein U-like protein